MTSTLSDLLFEDSYKGNDFQFIADIPSTIPIRVFVFRNGKYVSSCIMTLWSYQEESKRREFIKIIHDKFEAGEGLSHE
jgi:hypothetical protein